MCFSVGLAGHDAVDEFAEDECLDGGRGRRELCGLDETEDAVGLVEGDGVGGAEAGVDCEGGAGVSESGMLEMGEGGSERVAAEGDWESVLLIEEETDGVAGGERGVRVGRVLKDWDGVCVASVDCLGFGKGEKRADEGCVLGDVRRRRDPVGG